VNTVKRNIIKLFIFIIAADVFGLADGRCLVNLEQLASSSLAVIRTTTSNSHTGRNLDFAIDIEKS
jgi:hypothetical protein